MQATTSIAAPPPAARPTAERSTDRAQLPQYSLRQILAIWAAAALPMGLLVNQAYPTRRFQSTWMGLITHTMPSFVIVGFVLSLVLG